MTPLELVAYYANLLILQYLGKPKAYAEISTFVSPVIMPQTTVQQLTFSDVATSGSFILQYSTFEMISVAWNESAASIQTALQLLSGLSEVTVTGSIASQNLVITMTGVFPPVLLCCFEQFFEDYFIYRNCYFSF